MTHTAVCSHVITVHRRGQNDTFCSSIVRVQATFFKYQNFHCDYGGAVIFITSGPIGPGKVASVSRLFAGSLRAWTGLYMYGYFCCSCQPKTNRDKAMFLFFLVFYLEPKNASPHERTPSVDNTTTLFLPVLWNGLMIRKRITSYVESTRVRD